MVVRGFDWYVEEWTSYAKQLLYLVGDLITIQECSSTLMGVDEVDMVTCLAMWLDGGDLFEVDKLS